MKYSFGNWAAEMELSEKGVSLPCPKCRKKYFYSPRIANGVGGKRATRKYRACKFCGFWQEVNGKPYRCIAIYHVCKVSSVRKLTIWERIRGSINVIEEEGHYDWKPRGSCPKECPTCNRKIKKIKWAIDDKKHDFWQRLKLAKTFDRKGGTKK